MISNSEWTIERNRRNRECRAVRVADHLALIVSLCRCAALVVMCIAANTNGQDVVSPAVQALGFNLAFQNAYGHTNGFTAKVHLSVLVTNAPPTVFPVTLCQSGKQIRSEVHLTEFGAISELKKKALRQAGLDEVVAIYQATPGRIIVLYPKLHAYVELPKQDSFLKKLDEMRNRKTTRTLIGEELFGGHLCRKVSIADPGDPASAAAWERPDLNGFPIKIEITRKTEVTRFEAVSVDLTTPPASKFELPDGYTRYENSQELVQAAVRLAKERTNSTPTPH